MQGDGNLVVYSQAGAPVWTSFTGGHEGTYLAVQDDGKAVLYQGTTPLWEACGGLLPNQSLPAGQSTNSCDGRFRLSLLSTGDLVLSQGATQLWSAGIAGSGATFALMQTDGNFVVYAGSGSVWQSRTGGHPGGQLSVQNDGNLVVYQGNVPLWSSGTCCR